MGRERRAVETAGALLVDHDIAGLGGEVGEDVEIIRQWRGHLAMGRLDFAGAGGVAGLAGGVEDGESSGAGRREEALGGLDGPPGVDSAGGGEFLGDLVHRIGAAPIGRHVEVDGEQGRARAHEGVALVMGVELQHVSGDDIAPAMILEGVDHRIGSLMRMKHCGHTMGPQGRCKRYARAAPPGGARLARDPDGPDAAHRNVIDQRGEPDEHANKSQPARGRSDGRRA